MIVDITNIKASVFKIYSENVLQTGSKFVQDKDKFTIDGKTYVVLKHEEQLQYVIDNLEYALNKLLDFFPIRFIGRIAELKDEIISSNLQNLKNILSNDIVYKIINEAVSIKGFAPFISSFASPSDRTNWIYLGNYSYVVYRIN